MTRKPFEGLPDVDVADLIKVICKIRQERYRFERHIALRTFSAWVFWPTNSRIIHHAKIVSAARVIRMVQEGDLPVEPSKKMECLANIVKEAMPLEPLADVLINPPLKDRFCLQAEESFGVTDIYQVIEFFLSCPIELRPSLNKAIYFMKRGGFRFGSSSATLRANWVLYVTSSPFIFVDFPAIDLQPDDIRVAEGIKLLGNESKLVRYFGGAKYVQEQLMGRLDPTTRRRFKFVEFPREIDARPVEIQPYSPRQIDIIKSYRAPKID